MKVHEFRVVQNMLPTGCGPGHFAHKASCAFRAHLGKQPSHSLDVIYGQNDVSHRKGMTR